MGAIPDAHDKIPPTSRTTKLPGSRHKNRILPRYTTKTIVSVVRPTMGRA